MSAAPIQHDRLAGDVFSLTLTGADGRKVSAIVTGAGLRAACWGILADIGGGEHTWRSIAQPVLEARGVTMAQIMGPSKHKHVSRARQAVCWELMQVRDTSGERRWTNMAIGRFLGITASSVLKGARAHAARTGCDEVCGWRQKPAFRPIAERVE